jgi:cadmium resistance protein CadD (predicted permease)
VKLKLETIVIFPQVLQLEMTIIFLESEQILFKPFNHKELPHFIYQGQYIGTITIIPISKAKSLFCRTSRNSQKRAVLTNLKQK